jgi:hypothetical protein
MEEGNEGYTINDGVTEPRGQYVQSACRHVPVPIGKEVCPWLPVPITLNKNGFNSTQTGH